MRPRAAAALVAAAAALVVPASADGPSEDQTPLRVEGLNPAAARVRTIDTIETVEKPWRLAWSPDGSELYVQILDGEYADAQAGRGRVSFEHYLYSLADGSKNGIESEPSWAGEYWRMKSNRHAPDAPELSISLDDERRIEQTTQVPRGGDLAKGGTTTQTGTSVGDAAAAAYSRQTVFVNYYAYKGERIGEFVNSVVVHGLTFGWGPPGTGAIAFATPKGGKLIVMDDRGSQKEIPATRNALLPAWSHDGRQLAWLEKQGRKKYELKIVTLSGS